MSFEQQPADLSPDPAAVERLMYRLLFAFLGGALVLGTLVLMIVGRHVPASSVFALLLLAARPFIDTCGRDHFGPHGPPLTWLALVLCAPALGIGAHCFLADPLVRPSGESSMHEDMLHFWVFGAWALLPFLAGAVMSWHARLRLHERPRFARILGVLVWLHLAGATILFGFSCARERGRPDTDHFARYLSSLPVVTTLPPISELKGSRLGPIDQQWLAFRSVSAGIHAQRVLQGKHGCYLSLASQPYRLPIRPPLGLLLTVEDCWTMELRRDDRQGLLLTLHDGQVGGIFLADSMRRLPGNISSVSRALAPPVGWVVVSGIGLLSALWALWARRPHLLWLRRRSTWLPGERHQDGTIHFHGDAPPCQAPPRQELAAGPVVVLPLGPRRLPTYRDPGDLGPIRVHAGTIDELAARLGAAVQGHHAFALAALLLTSAPLLAAAVMGLVF